MGQRTDIAKALRDDEIQYLKALASGKPAEKHTEKIVGDYQFTCKTEILMFCMAIGVGVVCLMFANGKTLGYYPANLVLTGIAWICSVLLLIYRFCSIHDFRTAEKIYPEVNAILGAQTEFRPSWLCFPFSIVFAVIFTVFFVLEL